MTWYANRIYVNASDAAIQALRAEPALAGHLFLLSGSLPASWQPGSGELALPGAGLVVVREVGPSDSDDDSDQVAAIFGEPRAPGRRDHSWYGPSEWLSWDALRGPAEVAVRVPDVPELAACDVPPRAFLQYLANLRASCGGAVTYYLGRTFGGGFEGEAAWVFAEREVLYCHRVPQNVNVGPTDEVVVADANGQRVIHDDVLRLALAHHGLHLPTGYFEPHRRRFDWEGRRL
jgi:hypothetical protein